MLFPTRLITERPASDRTRLIIEIRFMLATQSGEARRTEA
jgi:hypothetical protein